MLRLKFPEGLNSLGSNTIIHQSRNIVKGKQEIYQKKDYGETDRVDEYHSEKLREEKEWEEDEDDLD